MTAETTPTTQYKQVTVDVPEDRLAEFHAFFGRFLAGSFGRGRRGHRGRPYGGPHGRRCAERRETGEQDQPAATTEI